MAIGVPGIDRFQVPHHGSRRNVSTAVFDRWLGPRLRDNPAAPTFHAFCSAAKADEDHPRRSVKWTILHRGGDFYDTKAGHSIRTSFNAPARQDYGPLTPNAYADGQEE